MVLEINIIYERDDFPPMTKIDIISGFLGAGKTTLIRKLIAEAYTGEKLVLIENEFGEIAVDGGFLQDAGVQITEMNSGCICCSLVGDFSKALQQVLRDYAPDRILIEPSGVGKLSDVAGAVVRAEGDGASIGAKITVADAMKCKLYSKNFGEFYDDQVSSADMIILSRTANMAADKIEAAVAILRERNPHAVIVTTPWDQLSGAQLREAAEEHQDLQHDLHSLEEEHAHSHSHEDHDDDDDDDACCCGHDHHDHEDHEHEEHEHEHHHHHDDEDDDDDDDECCCGHDHEHEHDDTCSCGHDHHHHHDADEVFMSWGVETTHAFDAEALQQALNELDEGQYGLVLRAKGIVPNVRGGWLHFDYVPGEIDVRSGPAAVTGRLCVIGSKLDEHSLPAHFGLN